MPALESHGSLADLLPGRRTLHIGLQEAPAHVRTDTVLAETTMSMRTTDLAMLGRMPAPVPARPRRKPVQRRGLAIKRFTLTSEFGSRFSQWFRTTNNLYLVGYAWDLSSKLPIVYPSEWASPDDLIIRLRPGETKEYGGVGDVLLPPRPVKGGVSVRLHLWRFHGNAREFGDTLRRVNETVASSGLTKAVSTIAAAAAGGPLAAGAKVAIENLVDSMAESVGTILSEAGDDQVDFFSGHYRASPWAPPVEAVKGRFWSADLSRL